ncbi:MAG: hypothetical protein GY909_10945 [Oligoflexia bacterium]|nr:hypothetical protein [Oligoflexia bacterium]
MKELDCDYKIYSKIFREAIKVKFKLGVDIKPLIKSLKQGLIKDIQFQKKFEDLVRGTQLQMLAMAFIIWGFIFLFEFITKVRANHETLILIGTLNILGLFIYFVLQKKLLHTFGKTMEKPLFVFLNCLFRSQIGLSMSDVILEEEFDALENHCPKPLINFRALVKNSLSQYQNFSRPISNSQEEIIEEYWFVMGQQFEKTLKKVKFLQFTVGVIFYIPCYFLFLASFLSTVVIN